MTGIRKQKHRQKVKINKARKYVTRYEQKFMSNLLHSCPHLKKKRYKTIIKVCKWNSNRIKVLLNSVYGDSK